MIMSSKFIGFFGDLWVSIGMVRRFLVLKIGYGVLNIVIGF